MNIPILLYHKITNEKEMRDDVFSISLADFKSQMEFLKSRGYTSISQNDLLNHIINKKRLAPKSIMITFDDSSESLLSVAKTVLDNTGFKPIVFVASKSVGMYNFWDNPDEKTRVPCLDKNSLLTLIKQGWEIGSHSLTHAYLMKITEEKIIKEIYGSKFDLEQILHTNVISFAYPYGEYSDAIKNIVIKAGYKLGFSITSPSFTVTGDQFLIRRVLIQKSDSVDVFKRKISNLDLLYRGMTKK
jgi:peptidoglycan/xylan/chitin deacetylase (PgdA/CDA1 family)